MKTARIFQILAVILLGIAAYFLWLGIRDGVFVSLVLSGCAYFLSMRFQIRERLQAQEAAEESAAETEPEDAPDPNAEAKAEIEMEESETKAKQETNQ